MALTAKQEQFCNEYLIDLNGTQAAIRAGYAKKYADIQAVQLLKNTKVSAYIKELQQKRQKRTDITADRVIKELAKIAFINADNFYNDDGTLKLLSELDSDTRGALRSYSIKTINLGDGLTEEVPVHSAHDKLKALEMLAKHLGILEKQAPMQDETNNKKIIIAYE